MRLWSQQLIPQLPRQQLLGQHRECAALRGAGWGRPHSVVNYVFTYSPNRLVAYHHLIMDEMERRGYHPDPIWRNPKWRGTRLKEEEGWANDIAVSLYLYAAQSENRMIYPEHDEAYLKECIDNLKGKGIDITN